MQRRHWLTAAAAGLGMGSASVWWALRPRPTPLPLPAATPSPGAATSTTPTTFTTSTPTASGTQALWAARMPQAGGGELVLAQLKGRPLLLNFWATWCTPCVKEMPLLDRFAREQGDRIAVVGIAIDRAEAVQAFLAKTPVGFRIGVAGFAGGALLRELGNAQGGLPFTVLLDRQGEPIERRLGETHPEDLQAWAKRLSS
jgi:thiol-disulfide isomerase/thioredoxin